MKLYYFALLRRKFTELYHHKKQKIIQIFGLLLSCLSTGFTLLSNFFLYGLKNKFRLRVYSYKKNVVLRSFPKFIFSDFHINIYRFWVTFYFPPKWLKIWQNFFYRDCKEDMADWNFKLVCDLIHPSPHLLNLALLRECMVHFLPLSLVVALGIDIH